MTTKTLSLVFAASLSLFVLLNTSWAKPPCVRHNNVGFYTPREILGELAQVYANCYPQPACTSPQDLETIQIDGYTNFSGWLWSGPANTTFTVAQQDALIKDAIIRANKVKPSGKVIVKISFFRDIIVPQGPGSHFIYFKVTFARCSQSRKGMTWVHTLSNAQYGTITVGCGPAGPNRCDAAKGDTLCTQQLPVLCIYKPKPAFQKPVGLPEPDWNNRWSGGVVATTKPVAGDTFKDSAAVNAYCKDAFGEGWRVAEFHDGWGWNFQAYGGTVSAPTVPSTRFWVYINDQPNGNCWQQ
jgi:hypothetical protein